MGTGFMMSRIRQTQVKTMIPLLGLELRDGICFEGGDGRYGHVSDIELVVIEI